MKMADVGCRVERMCKIMWVFRFMEYDEDKLLFDEFYLWI